MTISVVDDTPPLVTNVSPNPQEIGGCVEPTTTTIQATVSDVGGVADVFLNYQNETPGSSPYSATMTTTDGKSFTTQLSVNDLSYGTYDFYIVAYDRSGNRAQSGTYRFNVTVCIG